MSCDLAKNPIKRSGFALHILKAKPKDLGSISTSSSHIRTARVFTEGLGRNRALRSLEGWRTKEMVAEPNDERVRLCANSSRVWAGVDGFPQRTSTAETIGDAEYVAVMDWRRGIRDSEKPLMRTVI